MTPQAFMSFAKSRSPHARRAAFRYSERGNGMEHAIEPREVSFDAYTMCSFLPNLDSSRLVPKEGVASDGLTQDPYYAKVLRDPHTYFTKKLNKYIEETGSVKRGIEMLIDCHQNHLAFTPLVRMTETP